MHGCRKTYRITNSDTTQGQIQDAISLHFSFKRHCPFIDVYVCTFGYVPVCMCLSECACVSAGANRVQEELELQTGVSCRTWFLGTQIRSSTRVAHTFSLVYVFYTTM